MEDRAARLAWFTEEILPHIGAVRRCVVRLGIPASDVEDFVAEALVRAYAHNGWRDIARSKSFLLQIARNLVCDAARRHTVAPLDLHADMDALGLVDQTPSPEAVVCERQRLAIMRRAILGLPPDYSELVRMRWSEELAILEIANRLGLSISTVEKRLASVIVWLRGEFTARGRFPAFDPDRTLQPKLPRRLARQPQTKLRMFHDIYTDD